MYTGDIMAIQTSRGTVTMVVLQIEANHSCFSTGSYDNPNNYTVLVN